MNCETEIKLIETTSTEVKNRLLGPEEMLRAIDTGALYVAGPGGVPQAMVTARTSGSGAPKQMAGNVIVPSSAPTLYGLTDTQSRKIGFKTATDRFDVFTRGGPTGRALWLQWAINWGDATAGVSIGTAWAFWRMGLVRTCTSVIAGRYTPDTVTGTWSDVDYGVTTGDARATGYGKRSSTAGDTAQYNGVTFRDRGDGVGVCDIYIRGTSGGANRFEIEVDGVVQLANQSATVATPTTLKFTVTATPGSHTVRLRNTNTGGGLDKLGILAVNGIDLVSMDVPATHPVENVWAEWSLSEAYAFSTGTMGAWEYAFDRAADGVFGGNFHGGEVATSAAVFKLDGTTQGVAALGVRAAGYVFTTLEIFQHTTVDSAMVITSRHSLPSDYHWQFDFQASGSWLTKNAYWCMSPVQTDFSTVTYPDAATLTVNGTRVPFADVGRIVQQNSKGQVVETEWTQTVPDYGDSFGGKVNMWPNPGAYCKVYKGIYGAALPTLLVNPAASARRRFA